MSHNNISEIQSQRKARTAADGRRRRSQESKNISDERNLAVNDIVIKTESTGLMAVVNNPVKEVAKDETTEDKPISSKNGKKDKKSKKNAKQDKQSWISEINKRARNAKVNSESENKKVVAKSVSKASAHAGSRHSLKAKSKY